MATVQRKENVEYVIALDPAEAEVLFAVLDQVDPDTKAGKMLYDTGGLLCEALPVGARGLQYRVGHELGRIVVREADDFEDDDSEDDE